MSALDEFRPRWASPPGDSIRTALAQQDWDIRRLSAELEVSESVTAGLLDGSTRVTMDLARRLADSLGGSTRFWMLRDAKYCQSTDWVKADRWVSLLPAKEMHDLDWIRPFDDWYSKVTSCMEFFGVDSPREIHGGPHRVVTSRYRATPKTPEQNAAIAAWVRRVELQAQTLRCDGWNSIAFQTLFPQLAELSRMRDPQVFMPKLQQLACSTGVAVVAVRPPRGCPANGVSMTLKSGVRAIGLSGRYLADDHFWFTFFHEAGHLVRHDPSLVFIDEIERNLRPTADDVEREADLLASEVLFPTQLREYVPRKPTPYTVHGLSKRAGVSTGVIVGQLQHAGLIPFNSRLNRLKNRYRWEGSVLTRGNA